MCTKSRDTGTWCLHNSPTCFWEACGGGLFWRLDAAVFLFFFFSLYFLPCFASCATILCMRMCRAENQEGGCFRSRRSFSILVAFWFHCLTLCYGGSGGFHFVLILCEETQPAEGECTRKIRDEGGRRARDPWHDHWLALFLLFFTLFRPRGGGMKQMLALCGYRREREKESRERWTVEGQIDRGTGSMAGRFLVFGSGSGSLVIGITIYDVCLAKYICVVRSTDHGVPHMEYGIQRGKNRNREKAYH